MATVKLTKKEKDFRNRVAKGAKLLDKNRPDWLNRFIKRGLKMGFDLEDSNICVLGHVFARLLDYELSDGYISGLLHLGIKDDGGESASKYGFCTSEDEPPSNYAGLAEAWQVEILSRVCTKSDQLRNAVRVFRT